MQAVRKSIEMPSTTLSRERFVCTEHAMAALSMLAVSRQTSLSPECLLLMAQDLADVPWHWLEPVIHGWRRGILRMGRPAEMDKFPTVRQLRLQALLLKMEREG